jgi:FAD-dependent oxidoreductase domain-containing protein 1
MNTASNGAYDVVIMGGGIIGSSTAYFLKCLDQSLSVCVVEPDPTYEFASTLRASGGARRLFSCPENIEMSNFSIDFIKRFPHEMAVDGEPAAIDWREQGYLFIVGAEEFKILEANHQTQTAHGCDVRLLTPAQLKELFPSINVSDIAGASYSPRDGWCDPNSFLQGFKRRARSLGVEYRADRVTGLSSSGHAISTASTEAKATLRAGAFVNAAGAWSASICAMAGVPLPIQPQRRFEHFFSSQEPIEPLPLVKDIARLAFRPEGKGYSGGLVDSYEPWGFNFEVDHNYFERIVWPALAHRFPQFEATKCHRTWAGLYEVSTLDGNPIIGNIAGQFDNFYVAAGFSGHGLMHAPATGRAIAELICKGEFQTIDLARLGYARVKSGTPYRERGIL